MASETFAISPCTPDDLDAMVGVYERAFADDYFFSFAFPRSSSAAIEDKQRWLRARFLATFSHSNIRNVKVIESSSGRIVAWARWGFPYTLSDDDLKASEAAGQQQQAWPLGSSVELCEAMFGGWDRMREVYLKKDDMYGTVYLSTYLTKPNLCFLGLLNSWLIDECDSRVFAMCRSGVSEEGPREDVTEAWA
jgi:hypothetical protein